MMATTLGRRGGRAAALAVLVLLLAAGVAAVAGPLYWLHQRYDQRLEDLNDRLAGYRRVAASREGLRLRLAQMAALDGRRFYLKSSAASLAAGEVQEVVKLLVEAYGGRLASMQILAHREEDGVRRVGVNVQFVAGLATVQDVLRSIESREPYLFIDNLSMRLLRGAEGKPAAGGAGMAEDELMVQADVIGYALPGQAP